jgi:hypothetical protein
MTGEMPVPLIFSEYPPALPIDMRFRQLAGFSGGI